MSDALLLANVHTVDGQQCNVAIADGVIAALRAAGEASGGLDCGGALLTPALADLHLHPDKAYLLDEEDAADSLAGAIARVRQRKPGETAAAVAARTVRLLNECLRHGTTAVRLHAEVDPLLGLRSVEGVLSAAAAFHGRVSTQVVAFAQEGILQEPGTEALLRRALRLGAHAVGGITYQDADTAAHLEIVCGLAREFACPLDLHADFCLPAGVTALPLVAAKVAAFGLGGRTLVGHCTSLAKLPEAERDALTAQLADAGVALVALPRTDLFLDGCIAPLEALEQRGLRCFIATNNVQNAFTSVGEASLPQVGQVYALARTLGTRHGLTRLVARLWQAHSVLGLPTISDVPQPGEPADLCLWDCEQPWQIVARGLSPRLVVAGGKLLPRA